MQWSSVRAVHNALQCSEVQWSTGDVVQWICGGAVLWNAVEWCGYIIVVRAVHWRSVEWWRCSEIDTVYGSEVLPILKSIPYILLFLNKSLHCTGGFTWYVTSSGQCNVFFQTAAVEVTPAKFKRERGVHCRVSPWNWRPRPFHGRFMAVSRPWVDTSQTIRQRFTDVTPIESVKIAYYTPIPRLQFLTLYGCVLYVIHSRTLLENFLGYSDTFKRLVYVTRYTS